MAGALVSMLGGGGRIMIAGQFATDIGFQNGGGSRGATSFGSLKGGLLDRNGYTIDEMVDNNLGSIFHYSVEGNHTGAIFTSLVFPSISKTFARASAVVPNGTYDAPSNSTYWDWTAGGGVAGFTNGLQYPFYFT